MITVMPTVQQLFLLLSENAILIVFSLLLLAILLLLILYLQEYWTNVELRQEPIRLTEATREKSFSLLHNAIKKAQDIIGRSELEGIKITADNRTNLQKLEKVSEQAMHEASLEAKTYIEKAQQTFTDYLTALSQQAGVAVSENEKVVKDRINKLFEDFEQNLSTYLTQTQQESVRAITLEVQAARQLIETYKTEQFRLVDENIVAMLERTLSLVLLKKLSLKDQVDLVYESLEKAKAEKFII